jgi:hypothetical protein
MERHFPSASLCRALRSIAISTGTVVALTIFLIAALCQPSIARAPTWTISVSPNASGGITVLNDVACVGASFCMGVGFHESGPVESDAFSTLSELWNGSDWVLIPTPNPGSDIYSELTSITCPTPNDCMAVGTYGAVRDLTLVEHWDGRKWSILPSPNAGLPSRGFPPFNVLSGVSCSSQDFCVAVGSTNYGLNYHIYNVLIETWNGSTWSVAKGANVRNEFNELLADSCSSARYCVAVGELGSGTLIETWNGSKWSIVPANANPASSDDGILDGISCVNSTYCVAVGALPLTKQNLVESWNGEAWIIVPSPNQGSTANLLSGVACTTATTCVAVGATVDQYGSPANPLIESWNGAVWTLSNAPAPASATDASLDGISCPGPAECVAVGQTFDSFDGFADTALTEVWNGTSWNMVASPASTLTNNFLLGISCIDPASCTAVGGFFNGNGDVSPQDESLIETLSGGVWSTIVSPNEPDVDNYLQGVSCTSGTFCMAVGSTYFGNAFDKTLAETWSGTSWSVTPTPTPDVEDQLLGVSCTSPTFCMAVGSVIEEWNGSSWSVAANPMAPSTASLTGVSCTSVDMCVAVGTTSYSGGQTLAETWNGSSWVVEPSPVASDGDSYFNSVSCASATYCVAVGFMANRQGPPEPLAASWDGQTWTSLSGPTFGAGGAELSGVSCPETAGCTAVGIRSSNRGKYGTMAETLSGTVWTLLSIPNEPGGSSILEGVSCTTDGCSAVGGFQNHQLQEQTLIESESPAPSIVATSGASQSVDVHKALPVDLQATVLDGSGNPLPGVRVTFEAPPRGPSGRFSSKDTVITNGAGVATAPRFTANGIAGSYEVKGVASGITGSAVFKLTNLPLAARTTLTLGLPGPAAQPGPSIGTGGQAG